MLSSQQRQVLAQKFADLGNIAVGSLVFGVVVRSDIFDYVSIMLGIIIGIMAYGFTVVLTR